MEVSIFERVGELPAPLADGRCFRKASISEVVYPDDPVAAGREYSPLHGRRLSAWAKGLQREAVKLPAARAAERISDR